MEQATRTKYLLLAVLTIGYLGSGWQIVSTAGQNIYAKDFLQDYLLTVAWASGVDPYQSLETLSKLFLPEAASLTGAYFPHPTPHPPLLAVAFLPFLLFSFTTAAKLYFALQCACLVLALWSLNRQLGSVVPREVRLLLSLLFISSFPLRTEFHYANLNLLQLAFTCLFLEFYDRKAALSGSCLAITIALKFGGILFLPYLALKRRWDILLPCAAVLAGMLGVLALKSDLRIVVDYFTIHAPAVTKLYGGVATNFSLWTIPRKVFEGVTPVPFFPNGVVAPALLDRPEYTIAGKILILLPAFLLTYLLAFRSKLQPNAMAILIAASTILTPSAWHHSLLILALPVALIFNRRCTQSLEPKALLLPTIVAFAASFGSALCWFILDLPEEGSSAGAAQTVVTEVAPLPLLFVSLAPTAIVAAIIWLLFSEDRHSAVPDSPTLAR